MTMPAIPPPPTLIDTHAHLSDEAFQADREAALRRAREAGVLTLVEVGTDLETSRRALAFAEAHEGVYAVVGIHPHEGDAVSDATMAEVRAMARSSRKVVGLGETGLDFYRNRSSREGQERSFRAHVALARETGLPLVLHLRSSANAGEGASDAYEGAIAILAEAKGEVRGVSHCFSGTPALAARFCELGFHVSLAGNATYPAAAVLREAARSAPLDRLLVETDCPYLPPIPHRGKRNEPAHVRLTATALAAARGMGLADFAAATTANARRLFGLPASGGA